MAGSVGTPPRNERARKSAASREHRWLLGDSGPPQIAEGKVADLDDRIIVPGSASDLTEVRARSPEGRGMLPPGAMRQSLISLILGLAVGVVYGLLRVRSPAPPLVALVGLLGMLAGERAASLVRARFEPSAPQAAAEKAPPFEQGK
jgi:XapX domain-containing protein